jgi:hypothetical protein
MQTAIGVLITSAVILAGIMAGLWLFAVIFGFSIYGLGLGYENMFDTSVSYETGRLLLSPSDLALMACYWLWDHLLNSYMVLVAYFTIYAFEEMETR